MSRLAAILDLRHPFAYLALGPSIAFAHEAGVEIDWLPMRAQTLRPPPGATTDDDRSLRHKHHRAEMIAREIAVYAAAQGLVIEAPYRDAPSAAFEAAWLWLRATAPEALEAFLEEGFRRYWACDLDADRPEAIDALLAHCGLDAAAFRSWAAVEGERAAAEVARRLTEAGVFQTPAFLLGDEVFIGRQHLPLIRWRMDGECGPVPI